MRTALCWLTLGLFMTSPFAGITSPVAGELEAPLIVWTEQRITGEIPADACLETTIAG